MKNIILSSAIILAVVVAVIFSSLFVSFTLGHLEQRVYAYSSVGVENLDFDEVVHNFSAMREEFKKEVWFLSLLVSDTALGEIESTFGDVINYAEAKSGEGVLISVARLHENLEHLRRLSEFSPESVF